ncbi:unnamed protein product, partial [Rotaria magnacalcarata]
FAGRWEVNNKSIVNAANFRDIAERAAKGILAEGKLLQEDFDAQSMAKDLRSCIDNEEIFACAARLYSNESFLYKLLNSTLRNNDITKLETLGPFCYLLNWHLVRNNCGEESLLFRGMDLTDDIIDEYRQAIGKIIVWSAYTSTTKDPRVAEMFANNTIVIITAKRDNHLYRSDISSLSRFPDEQEVLMDSQYKFHVDKIERDSVNKKCIIYMTTVNRDL